MTDTSVVAARPSTARLPVTVVTGFLGAGKTTLLRHLLLHSGLRLAVLVNEFGEVGLDGDLIAACGFCPEEELDGRLVELTNGCLCCTVQDDFLPTMTQLLERSDRLDGILVETSGLALPEPLINAFGWPEIRTRTRVQGVIAVVDGEALAAGHVVGDLAAIERQRREDPSLDHLEAIEDLFADQLAAADLVLISRTDRMTSEQLQDVESRLQSFLPQATAMLPIPRGQIDPALVLGLESPARRGRDDEPSHHASGVDPHGAGHDHAYDHDHDHDHDHVDIHSFVVRREGRIERRALEQRLQQILREVPVLRLKGRLRLQERRLPLQIQGVGRRLDCWFEQDPPSRRKPVPTHRDGAAPVLDGAGPDPVADQGQPLGICPGPGSDQLELVVLGAARNARLLEEAFGGL